MPSERQEGVALCGLLHSTHLNATTSPRVMCVSVPLTNTGTMLVIFIGLVVTRFAYVAFQDKQTGKLGHPERPRMLSRPERPTKDKQILDADFTWTRSVDLRKFLTPSIILILLSC